MTLPIVFTATPHDATTDNADAADAFGQVATTTAANFEKINAHLVARRPSFGTTKLGVTPTLTADAVWHDFPSGWDPLILAVPAKPAHMLISIGAFVAFDMVSTSIYVSFRVSGAGAYAHDVSYTAVGGRVAGVCLSRSAIIPASYLTPGTNVTVTPQYMCNGTGSIANGALNGIALV